MTFHASDDIRKRNPHVFGEADASSAPSAIGRQSQAQGAAAEDAVVPALRRYGCRMIERIHTPWKVLWKDGKPVKAWTVESVSGDYRAVCEDGRSVLVEVKSRKGRLVWSALEAHQVEALDWHSHLGGLSLLVWLDTATGRVHVFEWPIDHFGPGTSLPLDE